MERYSNEVSADNVVLNIPVCEKRYIVYLSFSWIPYHLNNAIAQPLSVQSTGLQPLLFVFCGSKVSFLTYFTERRTFRKVNNKAVGQEILRPSQKPNLLSRSELHTTGSTNERERGGKPVQITVAQLSGRGPCRPLSGPDYVAYVFVFPGSIIICRL